MLGVDECDLREETIIKAMIAMIAMIAGVYIRYKYYSTRSYPCINSQIR